MTQGACSAESRLVVARDWAAHHDQDLNANERAFLAASQHDHQRITRRRHVAITALAILTLLSVSIAAVAVKLGKDHVHGT